MAEKKPTVTLPKGHPTNTDPKTLTTTPDIVPRSPGEWPSWSSN